MLYWEGKKRYSVVVSRSVETEKLGRKSKEDDPYISKKNDVRHVLFSCLETRKWRMEFLSKND